MDKPIDRHAARIRDESAGAFALLAEKNHPLVRILSDHTYRGFQRWTVLCVVVPLVALAAALTVAATAGWTTYSEDWDALAPSALALWNAKGAGIFLVAWPGICILGAALTAAGTVSSERTRESALQLVLTPLPMRPIAASKILPAVRPFLWGIAATVPLYCLAGDARIFHASDDHMSVMWPSVTWPLRAFTLRFLHEASLGVSPTGIAVGLAMAAADAGLAWAAAHWGAALAVRWKGSLPAVILALSLRLAGAAGAACGFWFLTLIGIFWLQLPGPFRFVPVVLHATALLALWYVWPVRGAVRRALAEFAFFDRLADDEPMPSRQRRFAGRRWWEVNWRQ